MSSLESRLKKLENEMKEHKSREGEKDQQEKRQHFTPAAPADTPSSSSSSTSYSLSSSSSSSSAFSSSIFSKQMFSIVSETNENALDENKFVSEFLRKLLDMRVQVNLFFLFSLMYTHSCSQFNSH